MGQIELNYKVQFNQNLHIYILKAIPTLIPYDYISFSLISNYRLSAETNFR